MAGKIRAIHYLNQFFGGLGGEEQADAPPRIVDGAVGPGRLIAEIAPDIEIVATVIAGDNHMADTLEDGAREAARLIRDRGGQRPKLLLAGPAFNAGRYGMACGAVCGAIRDELGVPVLTAMYEENPAVEIYRRNLTIVRTGPDVMGMRDAITAMTAVALKLTKGETIDPAHDGTLTRGLRANIFAEATGAERAIYMLLRKLAGEHPRTEYPMPVFDHVPPAPAVKDISQATVALVTTGGIVPRGNPDRIESANASKFGEYPLDGLDDLTSDSHQSVHGGYDPSFANSDPDRVLPLDVVRDLEREGRIGRLHGSYFATVGNATSVDRARNYGREIAALLVNVGVQAVILTST